MGAKVITTLLTVLAGVGAALALYWVLNKLAEHRIAPDRLTLEVTETAMARSDGRVWICICGFLLQG